MRREQLRGLGPVGIAVGQRLRRGGDRGDRRPQLVRDVADERAPHRLGALEARHVAQHADGGGAVALRQRGHAHLPDELVREVHGLLGGLPRPHRRLEAVVERPLAQHLVDAAAGRRRDPRHLREAAVALEHAQLRVHDDEPVRQPLEDHRGQPPLGLRALDGLVQRALHALHRAAEQLHLLAAARRQVAREVARGHGRGRARQLGDRLGEAARGARADQEEQQADADDRAAHRPEVAELDLSEPRRRDGQAQHAAVRQPARDVQHRLLLGRRQPARDAAPGGDGGADLLAAGVVLHARDVGRQQVGVVQDAPVRGDEGDAAIEGRRRAPQERVAPLRAGHAVGKVRRPGGRARGGIGPRRGPRRTGGPSRRRRARGRRSRARTGSRRAR